MTRGWLGQKALSWSGRRPLLVCSRRGQGFSALDSTSHWQVHLHRGTDGDSKRVDFVAQMRWASWVGGLRE